MPDYKEMYFKLFNQITDMVQLLQQAQRETEALFIESGEEEQEYRPTSAPAPEKKQEAINPKVNGLP